MDVRPASNRPLTDPSPPSSFQEAQPRQRKVSDQAQDWRKKAVAELKQPAAAAASPWDNIRTVAVSEEDQRHFADRSELRGCFRRSWFALQGWVLAIALGLLTALSGVVIELGTDGFASLRFGWCSSSPMRSQVHCEEGDWSAWGEGIFGFLVNIGLGAIFAAISAFMVWKWAPAASGSGIPEVKVILNGFVLSDAVSFRTLCVKVPGLLLSVAAGMSLGKEGPLVHVAMCWAQLLSRVFSQFQNEVKRRELFSASAAAGVSTAFGAPIGGILFSLEEVSQSFPSRTLLRAFTASVVAATVLQVIDLPGTRRLTMFSVDYKITPDLWELPVFALLGVLGGLVGAAFNALNVRWSTFRLTPKFKQNVHPITEVTGIALVTLLTSWPMMLTRVLSSEAIHDMFRSCVGSTPQDSRVELHLCSEEGAFEEATFGALAALVGAAAIRFFQMTLTFGTKCPAGLFVPSLYVGACLGRLAGVVVQNLNNTYHFLEGPVEPGIYAMIGAASVLGGVCRVTISLVVIMLELTNSLTLVVPFMLAVLIAKMVGDAFTEGIYDMYIILKGYPFLTEEMDVTYVERCCDVMETEMFKVDLSLRPTASRLRKMLSDYRFRGFPVVDSSNFIGYIRRDTLEKFLDDLTVALGEREGDPVVTMDELLPSVNCTVMRMVPDTLLSQAHVVFKQMRVQHIFLVGSQGYRDGYRQDVLQGMLSKKNFIKHLKDGHVGHRAAHPSIGQADQSGPRRMSTKNRISATTAEDSGLSLPTAEAHEDSEESGLTDSSDSDSDSDDDDGEDVGKEDKK